MLNSKSLPFESQRRVNSRVSVHLLRTFNIKTLAYFDTEMSLEMLLLTLIVQHISLLSTTVFLLL